jgi:hypothetical protein
MDETLLVPRWLPWIFACLLGACNPSPGATETGSDTESEDATAAGASSGGEPTDTGATGEDAGTTTDGDPDALTVPCEQCFPLEQLPDDLRAQAEELLLAALDREALYTIAADLKPMSSGFAELDYPADEPPPPELEELRTILAAFTCTPELIADVQVFHATFDGVAYADGLVFHRPRVVEAVEAFAEVFAALGVTGEQPPLAIVDAVDADPTTLRFRGYGHLFGYPEYAVDFFAEAAEHEAMTGEFVERDFIHIPTFESAEGRFVYAVPEGHQENAEDIALRTRAATVLERYTELRAASIGDGKPGVLHLVRTWFDDGAGRCSPRHAR